MKTRLPYRVGLKKSAILVWEHRFHWLMVVMICLWYSFLVSPLDAKIIREEAKKSSEEQELKSLGASVARWQARKELVLEKDRFTMERRLRTEFNLVNKQDSPSGLLSPPRENPGTR